MGLVTVDDGCGSSASAEIIDVVEAIMTNHIADVTNAMSAYELVAYIADNPTNAVTYASTSAKCCGCESAHVACGRVCVVNVRVDGIDALGAY